MNNQVRRTAAFRRNPALESLLDEINDLLGPAQKQIVEACAQPPEPVVMVVGAPRSGTTLSMQWLAASGCFGYPTNLLSRFYGAPYIGARIQQLLTDPRFDFNSELAELSSEVSFTSNLGKTHGALSPNEFWYFWRRFIPNVEPRHLSPEEEARIDGHGLARELAALQLAFEKPLVMKAMILQFNIPALARAVRSSFFFFVKRSPFFNVQSLLKAREKFYGTRAEWYSVQPPEYDQLRLLEPVEQVAGQIYCTNRSIETALARLPQERWLTVEYEALCRDPARVWTELARRLEASGHDLPRDYSGPESFDVTNQVRVNNEDTTAILNAWERQTGKLLHLPTP